MTDKRHVKFCDYCDNSNTCKRCDKMFTNGKILPTTSFYQVEQDITVFQSGGSKNMIVDLGCPNSVLSSRDENIFIQNLSKVQQKNLQYRKVDEKFKFGPSGPYKCSRKMKFPIGNVSNIFWGEMSVVDADIPMLLGNNILKPLEAKIQLFKTGNGVLQLNKTELELKETSNGHYTVKVSDLGKLCMNSTTDSFLCIHRNEQEITCAECDTTFRKKRNLDSHKPTYHEQTRPLQQREECANDFQAETVQRSTTKSSFKKTQPQKQQAQKQKHNPCLHTINTELNTLMNGAKEGQERKLILALKNILVVKDNEKNIDCDQCERTFTIPADVKNHSTDQPTKGDRLESIFLSHHEEDLQGSQTNCDDFSWDVLLSEEEADDLTEEEKKEILKFHRYFAHTGCFIMIDQKYLIGAQSIRHYVSQNGWQNLT